MLIDGCCLHIVATYGWGVPPLTQNHDLPIEATALTRPSGAPPAARAERGTGGGVPIICLVEPQHDPPPLEWGGGVMWCRFSLAK